MLRANDLTVCYGESTIIRGISFEAGPGAPLAIMGRNGMGKSTLFKALIGILPCRSGSVHVDSDDVSALPSYERVGRGLAYVPQGRMIFPSLTVRENIETGLRTRNGQRMLEEIHALFPALFDMRNRRGGDLSGGQQQQLAIARALAADPKVLLLDEPTEGIQPSLIKDLARALKELQKLRTITLVVSEQVLSFALEVAARIVVIERGSFVHTCERAQADAATLGAYLSV